MSLYDYVKCKPHMSVDSVGLKGCNMSPLANLYVTNQTENSPTAVEKMIKELREHGYYPIPKTDFEGECCYNTSDKRCRYVVKSNTNYHKVEGGLTPVVGQPKWKKSLKDILDLLDNAAQIAISVPLFLPVGGLATENHALGLLARYAKKITIEFREYDCDGYWWSEKKWRKEKINKKEIVIEKWKWIENEIHSSYTPLKLEQVKALYSKFNASPNIIGGKWKNHGGLPGDPQPEKE
jgi:hypothetical protein